MRAWCAPWTGLKVEDVEGGEVAELCRQRAPELIVGEVQPAQTDHPTQRGGERAAQLVVRQGEIPQPGQTVKASEAQTALRHGQAGGTPGE